MNEKGTSAIVYDNVLCSNIKTKEMKGGLEQEIVDQEVAMICMVPNKIGVALISYTYPHIQTQLMHETFTKFVIRKRPPLSVLLPIFNQISRYCTILHASGIFHCDLMTNNVMMFYRTPTSPPLFFFIDLGISYNYKNGKTLIGGKSAPRIVDPADKEYDFLFFMYSVLHCCPYLEKELFAHYEALMARMKGCFERYHNNGQNHQWYLVGTLCTRLCWKIGSSES